MSSGLKTCPQKSAKKMTGGSRLKKPINFQGRTVVGFRVPGSFGEGIWFVKNRGREYMGKNHQRTHRHSLSSAFPKKKKTRNEQRWGG